MSSPTNDMSASGKSESLLEAMLNLTASHREHEKFYSVSPREQAVAVQRHSRTLLALADRWSSAMPLSGPAFSPYEGADDLNASAALQLDGVLFMEGEGEPGEITHLKRDVRMLAQDSLDAGQWLDTAMSASWNVAPMLFEIEGLADLLGERHRIISNNWQGASMMTLIGRISSRAADILDLVDFSPAAVRADLAGHRTTVGRLYSAAEMLDHAADLLSNYAGLVHDNERRWRVCRARVGEVAATITDSP